MLGAVRSERVDYNYCGTLSGSLVVSASELMDALSQCLSPPRWKMGTSTIFLLQEGFRVKEPTLLHHQRHIAMTHEMWWYILDDSKETSPIDPFQFVRNPLSLRMDWSSGPHCWVQSDKVLRLVNCSRPVTYPVLQKPHNVEYPTVTAIEYRSLSQKPSRRCTIQIMEYIQGKFPIKYLSRLHTKKQKKSLSNSW